MFSHYIRKNVFERIKIYIYDSDEDASYSFSLSSDIFDKLYEIMTAYKNGVYRPSEEFYTDEKNS